MIKRLLLLFLTVVFLGEARAQLFPAQATTQLTPPYSLFLADYVAPGSERLALNVFLRDVSRPDINVRFRLRIIGQGISIETKPEFIPAPVSLQGGVPLRLIGIDLAEYFEPRNLNFSGISQREYEQRGGLPEGLYQFSFEVLEYNRGVKISNTSSASAWLILNDPPIVNLPRDNERIRPQDPQQVIFQWTPRHTGSPNAAFTTEYEFKLVELWPATRNPNDAILTSPPIFETTTRSTTLVYGPAETPLELGRRYAFQIKAKSIVGVEELNLFKNGGKSQVYTFQYGDACNVPQSILAEAPGATRFKVTWDAGNAHTAWKLRYRRDTANAAWFTTTSSLPELEIGSLQPTTTYEYEVMAVCGSFESPYSSIATITTRETPVIAYSCGLPIEEFDLDPSQLIPELKKGDVIDAGDFDVKLLTVSGGNGIFSGEGAIEVPYFNQVKAKVVFDNIKVNNDKRLVAGVMNVTGGGVEIVPEGVMDFMDQLSEVLDIADSALNIVDAFVQDNPPDPATFIADTLITVVGPLTVYPDLSNNGSVIVVDGNGNQQTLPPGTNYAITDDKGNGYLVDSKGQVTSTTAAQATASASREFNLTMKFEKASNGLYGLDNKTIAALARNYETLNNNYAVSWKAVAANSNEGVVARLEDVGIDASRIKYELSGTEIVATTAGEQGAYLLNLIGKSAGTVDELIGRIPAAGENDKEQVLGKLNVVSYDKKTYNLVLVPVNHSDDNKTEYPHNINQLKDSLNKIYSQAVMEWTVRDEDNLVVNGLSDTFDDGQSNAFSNYTEDMKKVINAFLAEDSFDEDTYYIFLLNKPKTANKLGFMPRKKQAGFVFLNTHGGDESALVKTIAHELAHGAFRLQHLWEEYSELKINTTDNLMDYTSGTKLVKFQWDLIHNPVAVLGLFEDDEEGAMVGDPIQSFILSKARELNLTNQDVVALLHCKVCTEEQIQTETIYDGNIEFNGIQRPTFLFKVPGSICLSILYNQTAGEEKLFVNLGSPANTTTLSTSGSKLSVFFANQSERVCTEYLDGLDDYLVCGQSQLESISVAYITKLYEQINLCLASPPTGNDIEVSAGVVVDQTELAKLQTLISDFKQRGIDSKVSIVSEAEFQQLQNTFTPEKQVHLLLGKTATGYQYKFYYQNNFFTYPTSKTLESGETVSFSYQQSEVDQVRDAHIAKAIANTDNIDELTKRPEVMLNIFERGMWVIKVTKETLAQVKVPVPMWDGNQPKTYPFSLQPTVAGIGDCMVDELKSIPDLLIMGLSLFDKQERDALISGLQSINLETIKRMFEEKRAKYAEGGDVAMHEGGYDAVQIASIFWGGAFTKGGKATKTAGEVEGFIGKIDDVAERIAAQIPEDLSKLSAKTQAKIFKKLAENPKLLEYLNENPLLAKAWTQHKPPYPSSADLDMAAEIAENADETVKAAIKELMEESEKKLEFLNRMGAARVFQEQIIDKWRKDFPDRFFTEVSFDVIVNGKTFRTRLDAIGFDRAANRYFVIEAKMGQAVFSENQLAFLKVLKDGAGEIIPRGQNAINIFQDLEGSNVLNLIDGKIRINDQVSNIKDFVGRGFN